MDLVRDLLDQAIVDCHRREIGRVDGIVFERADGGIKVRWLDVGAAVLGYRLYPAAGRVVEAVQWAIHGEPQTALRIPFSDVEEIGREVTLKTTLAEVTSERAVVRPAVMPQELRLEQLLGREVLAANNHGIGRLEEFRAERHGGRCTVVSYVIGAAGLEERLGLGLKLLFGLKTSGHVATSDQLDLTDQERPRLTCRLSELENV